ncbi:MAG: hypothetical protein R2939_09125 [Kofleriaceae bacterium]
MVAAVHRVEHQAVGRQHLPGLGEHRLDGGARHVLEHAVGEHHVDRARWQAGGAGVGRRVVAHDAVGGGREIAGRAGDGGGQRSLPRDDLGLGQAAELGEQRRVVGEALDQRRHQRRLEVAVEIEGVFGGTQQVEPERERRVPAGADLEQPRAGEGHAGVAQVADHQAQVVDLDVALRG